jgi:hypothetical protein
MTNDFDSHVAFIVCSMCFLGNFPYCNGCTQPLKSRQTALLHLELHPRVACYVISLLYKHTEFNFPIVSFERQVASQIYFRRKSISDERLGNLWSQ